MQAVVPAAGRGSRLRPLTDDRPKGLVEVAGQPLLNHVFDALIDIDISRVVVVIGYRGDQIRGHYGDSYRGTPVEYVTQEPRRGLADAVLQAAPHLDGPFVTLNGDNVCQANLAAVLKRHRETGADATALVEEVSRERAAEGGVFEREDGEVVGLVEKPETPPSTLIPRGFYAFSERILDACRLVTPATTDEYELTDAVDLLLYAGRRVETVRLEGWCRNVNTPADVAAVEQRVG